jgi:hypothetical protein
MSRRFLKRGVFVSSLLLLLVSSPALAGCKFIFDIYNTSGKRIHVKDAYYKVHKSLYETLNAGSVMDIANQSSSYRPGKPPVLYWVTNLVESCDTKVRFKFTYNCHDDDAGSQTHESYLYSGVGTADQSTIAANVKDCHGDVVSGVSLRDLGL